MPPFVDAALTTAKVLLHDWLTRQLSQAGCDWLNEKLTQLAETASERILFTTFSSISRHLGKQDLALAETDRQAAEAVRAGWCPSHWSVDQAGRSLLLLSVPSDDADRYVKLLDALFSTADVSEQVALYQSLPLLPHPQQHRDRAAQGIRSNMAAVFNAVALRNPYPAEHFDTAAWNQMVLKAIFIGSPLHLICNLDQRTNADLTRMLSDYAHERWAAKRPVTPELWRAMGPFVDDPIAADLAQVLAESDRMQQAAAALACAHSSSPLAQALLDQYPDFRNEIRSGRLTWDSFSHTYLSAEL